MSEMHDAYLQTQQEDVAMPPTSDSASVNGNVVNTTEADTAAPLGSAEDVDGIILDPKNSERQYYRDPITTLQREIWRPGS